jgi:hypothetical protein
MLATAAVLVVLVPAAFAATELTATLKGSSAFPQVNGSAKFKSDGDQRELEVQIEDANALIGKRLRVIVDGVAVGGMTVNSLGDARLRRDTERGQTVPVVNPGSVIKIKERAIDGGLLVASGTFS